MNVYTIGSIILTIAVLIGYLNHRFIKMQFTTAITMGSLALSFLLILVGEFGFKGLVHNVELLLSHIHFHNLLINGMLSFLLFAGALRINLNDLKKQKWEIGILAIAGTIASTLLLGSLTYFLLPLFGFHLPFFYCMLFGALISPTDPTAVLATFKELGAPRALRTMVEGEALFNDGVGIVIFLTIYQVVFINHIISWQHVSMLFLVHTIGGILYGVSLGLLLYWLMKPIDEHKIEILLTLVVVTAGYTFAQAIHVSGPLAMVVAGIFIGNRGRNFSMSTKTVKSLDNFWELIEEILNAILFLLIGLELLAIHIDIRLFITALFAIPLVLIIRTITVATPMNIFKKWRSYPPATIKILIWGGLRGGLALALALSLPDSTQRNLILGMTYAVVAFAIIVQSITIKSLIKSSKRFFG